MNKNNLNYHFKELRNRILFCLIFFIVIFGFSLLFSKEIYQLFLKIILLNKIEIERLIFTSPTEIFFSYIKISFLFSCFLSIPIFLIELYLFLSPALYKNEKKTILLIFFFAPILFILGALFSYFIIIPLALEFFLNFEIPKNIAANKIPIELEARISEILSFCLKLIFAFGTAFELPIILIMLSWLSQNNPSL